MNKASGGLGWTGPEVRGGWAQETGGVARRRVVEAQGRDGSEDEDEDCGVTSSVARYLPPLIF